MLLTEVTNEARSLMFLAEEQGEDPEPTAAQWSEATLAEAKAVVRAVYKMRPALKKVEWYEDFLSAHRWGRKNGWS